MNRLLTSSTTVLMPPMIQFSCSLAFSKASGYWIAVDATPRNSVPKNITSVARKTHIPSAAGLVLVLQGARIALPAGGKRQRRLLELGPLLRPSV